MRGLDLPVCEEFGFVADCQANVSDGETRDILKELGVCSPSDDEIVDLCRSNETWIAELCDNDLAKLFASLGSFRLEDSLRSVRLIRIEQNGQRCMVAAADKSVFTECQKFEVPEVLRSFERAPSFLWQDFWDSIASNNVAMVRFPDSFLRTKGWSHSAMKAYALFYI